MTSEEELFAIANKLGVAMDAADAVEIQTPLAAVEKAVDQVRRSFSGSWLGYHSRVYYEGLEPRPPGANFSQEWGMKQLGYSSMGSKGNWREFDPGEVEHHVLALAGTPDLSPARALSEKAARLFDASRSEVVSILENELAVDPDAFLDRMKEQITHLDLVSSSDVLNHWAPKGSVMTRDTLALGQGTQVPPHLRLLAEVASMRHAFAACESVRGICRKAASHLERKRKRQRVAERVGTNVFIGHGGSLAWRELKDFVQDRLRLPWDEFNRVPVAGVANVARLSEMLDAAAIALLVMTAEDEMADGSSQARMNVIHEAGLFQGRLGFMRAIVLLEEGCEEFSNIHGLGQLRFPKGRIAACFEEVRKVLEREGLVEQP